MPFKPIFCIESWNLRVQHLSNFNNPVLLHIEKGSSKKEVEEKFQKMISFTTFPSWISIAKFGLKKLIYINYVPLSFEKISNIEVVYGPEIYDYLYSNRESEYKYVMSISRYGDDINYHNDDFPFVNSCFYYDDTK
jgi:hypothetical protein